MGCFTDPHFFRVAKSRKSPKRPALPGAVIRVWAVHRPTPFHLLVFHTLSAALNRAFFRRRETRCFSAGKDGCRAPEGFSGSEPLARFRTRGPHGPFWGWVGYFSPPWVETRHNGPYTPEKPGAFPSGEDGCCAPEGFSLTKPQAWSCTQGRNRRDWFSFRL